MALMRVKVNNKELDCSKSIKPMTLEGEDRYYIYRLPIKNKRWSAYQMKSSPVRIFPKEVIDVLNEAKTIKPLTLK